MIEQQVHQIAFGEFRMLPARRLLLAGDRPVRLGSRAYDLLLALVERPGELVSKSELVARVWPDTFVDETNLRVHIAALRKVLGDGIAGARFLNNEPGRGYRFVAPVDISSDLAAADSDLGEALATPPLPSPLVRVVGRNDVVGTLAERIPTWRLASIVGPAGIGKTTVALVLAERLAPRYPDGVCYVDLSIVSDDIQVPGAVASALGLPVHTENPLPEIVAHLTHRRVLLVLDGCEGVVGAAAALVETLLTPAAGVHIVTTSREPLRATGEHVARLPPLHVPASDADVAAAAALRHSAIELFVERAAAVLDGFELTDADVPVVSEICRRLDGLPLAIELAAGRIDAFGLRGVADLLGDRFRLLSSGRRRALPRHQTLGAALDWSYDLLTEPQAAVFRRLGVFAGGFGLDAVLDVAAKGEAWRNETMTIVANLVAKSLLSADVSGEITVYRLLDTTRDYALRKLDEASERREISLRHALFNLHSLEALEEAWLARPESDHNEQFRLRLDNGRAALDWALSKDGNADLAANLTAASVLMWMRLSLVDECRQRVERAIAAAKPGDDDATRRRDMRLYAALGLSLMFTKGAVADTVAALEQTLALATALGDDEYCLRALWGLWVGRLNNGAIPESLLLAQRFVDIAGRSADALDRAVGERMIGFSLHFLGEHAEARRHITRMLAIVPSQRARTHVFRFQFDLWSTARATLAESLWIQGLADEARDQAQMAAGEAKAIGHAVTICNTLAKTSAVALHAGDLELAGEMIADLLATANAHALMFWRSEGGCLEGVRLLRSGNLDGGLSRLRAELRGFPGNTLTVRYIGFLGELADALSQAGSHADARAAVDEALERCNRNSENWCIAELLRIQGEIVRRADGPHSANEAERCFLQSLEWAHRQGALAWELRSATSLARLRMDQGLPTEAIALLENARSRFRHGGNSADVLLADRLIVEFAGA